MGNLTRAAYANQRMTLNSEIGKISKQRRNTMVALRGNPRGVFHHSCFCLGVCRCLELDVKKWSTSRSFCLRRCVAVLWITPWAKGMRVDGGRSGGTEDNRQRELPVG